MAEITAEHVAHWRRHGYVVVPDFLSPREVATAVDGFHEFYPTAEQWQADPRVRDDFEQHRSLPFASDTINLMSVNERLIDFVSHQLESEDVLITQALAWAKYGGMAGLEQLHHVDYGDNTLVVPRDEGVFNHIPTILYYTDVTPDHGPTYMVSREFTNDLPLWPVQRSRQDSPDLYDHEVPLTVTAGSLLIYSMETFHRGSALLSPGGCRFSHHVVFRASGLEYMGYRSFPQFGLEARMSRFLTCATPKQRSAVGFPKPGHPYWTSATLDGVARRYPNMDLEPYRKGLGLPYTA